MNFLTHLVDVLKVGSSLAFPIMNAIRNPSPQADAAAEAALAAFRAKAHKDNLAKLYARNSK